MGSNLTVDGVVVERTVSGGRTRSDSGRSGSEGASGIFTAGMVILLAKC